MGSKFIFDEEKGLIVPQQYVTNSGHVILPVTAFAKMANRCKIFGRIIDIFDDGLRGDDLEMEISGWLGVLERWENHED